MAYYCDYKVLLEFQFKMRFDFQIVVEKFFFGRIDFFRLDGIGFDGKFVGVEVDLGVCEGGGFDFLCFMERMFSLGFGFFLV